MPTKVLSTLRKQRIKNGYTVFEFASKLKVKPNTYESFEQGISMLSLEQIKKISKILNISTESILFSEEREPLSLSELKDDQKDIILSIYKMIKYSKMEE